MTTPPWHEHTCKRLPWLDLIKWAKSEPLRPLLTCFHWGEFFLVTHLTRGEYSEYIENSKNQRPKGKKKSMTVKWTKQFCKQDIKMASRNLGRNAQHPYPPKESKSKLHGDGTSPARMATSKQTGSKCPLRRTRVERDPLILQAGCDLAQHTRPTSPGIQTLPLWKSVWRSQKLKTVMGQSDITSTHPRKPG